MCEVRADGQRGARTLRYRFVTEIRFEEPARDHALVLRCEPRVDEGLAVLDGAVRVEPETSVSHQRDSFGNALAVCRIVEPHDFVRYTSEGTVRIDLSRAGRSDAHPLYRYPSVLAGASEEMCRWMSGTGLDMEGFAAGDVGTMHARVAELCHAVSREMTYEPGSTTTATTAAEAFAQRRGVCQDYAHVMVALLRQVGVAARYVSGIAVGEGCTHAWVQAHLGYRWWGFDPTRDVVVDETYLPLAVGRDWSDCPVERGSFVGAPGQSQQVHMEVCELGGHA